MKKAMITVLILAVAGAGIWYAFGGASGKAQKTFGKGTDPTLTTIAAIQQNPEEYLGKLVTIEGEMTKECPGSGCWWYVKDATGEMRSDSVAGGFALPLHQEGRRVRTTGKVTRMESGELQLAATGADLY